MRCDQVIRELAVPSDDRDPTAIAGHVTSCPACAAWANRAVQLDRLWQATRPSEPAPHAWDTVWTNLVASLESSTPSQLATISSQTAPSDGSPIMRAFPPDRKLRSWSGTRYWVVMTIGFTQAAAIFLAVTLTWSRFNPPQIPQLSRPADLVSSSPSLESVVQIDEGQRVVIVINPEGQAPRVIDRTLEEGAIGVAAKPLTALGRPGTAVDDFVMYNTMESMGISVVAMKE